MWPLSQLRVATSLEGEDLIGRGGVTLIAQLGTSYDWEHLQLLKYAAPWKHLGKAKTKLGPILLRWASHWLNHLP